VSVHDVKITADWASVAVAVIATAIAVLAWWEAHKARKDARHAAAIQRAETEHQGKIALEAMLEDYHSAIRAWSDEALDWMSQAHSLTLLDPSRMPEGTFFNARATCLWRLSSLIDRGRVFFPNEGHELHGLNKPAAYRGFRPVVLDDLTSVHNLTGDLHSPRRGAKSADEIRENIVARKREFVSAVQEAIDPRAKELRLNRIMGHHART
jgi:hypothetical protein